MLQSRLHAFFVRARAAQDHRPVGPGRDVRRPRFGRLRKELELVDLLRTLAVRRAEAVGSRVAAAEDDDVLAGREDLVRHIGRRRPCGSAGAEIPWRSGCRCSSRPGIGKSRAAVAPPARTIASKSRRRPSTATLTPTFASTWKTTPSSRICCKRRSTSHFSSLKSGMPYIRRPPIRSERSNTSTVWPARFSCAAAARPAGPEPTMAMRLPVRFDGGIGAIQPSVKAWSMICFSICLIVTGVVVDVEDAGLLARCRTDAPRELGEVVRRMEAVDRVLPAAAVDQIVPVRDDVPERAALVAEGDPAIHAARALRLQRRPRTASPRARANPAGAP